MIMRFGKSRPYPVAPGPLLSKQGLGRYPSRAGILVRIHDREEKAVYEKIIFEDGRWDEDVCEMYQRTVFNEAQMLIGPKFTPGDYFVIKRADLKAAV